MRSNGKYSLALKSRCFVTSSIYYFVLLRSLLWHSNALLPSSSQTPYSRGQQGEILARIHKAGFTIVAIKSMRLDQGRSRRILRGAQGAAVFWRAHRIHEFRQNLSPWCWRPIAQSASGVTPWERPIRRRQRPARFATTWAPASARTARTDRTLQRRRHSRLAISFLAWNSSSICWGLPLSFRRVRVFSEKPVCLTTENSACQEPGKIEIRCSPMPTACVDA